MDIFYQDLSFVAIHQQKAFETESLIGEIGGFLGLFLGKCFFLTTNSYSKRFIYQRCENPAKIAALVELS